MNQSPESFICELNQPLCAVDVCVNLKWWVFWLISIWFVHELVYKSHLLENWSVVESLVWTDLFVLYVLFACSSIEMYFSHNIFFYLNVITFYFDFKLTILPRVYLIYFAATLKLPQWLCLFLLSTLFVKGVDDLTVCLAGDFPSLAHSFLIQSLNSLKCLSWVLICWLLVKHQWIRLDSFEG